MHKNSTLNFFRYLSRVLLIVAIVCISSFMQSNVAKPVNEGYGILAKGIKCFPNPAVSFINFEFPADYISKDYTLQVYSFTGKKMYKLNVTSIKATLTFTTEFYRGIYVYQLQDKTGRILETGKFQVNK